MKPLIIETIPDLPENPPLDHFHNFVEGESEEEGEEEKEEENEY